MPVAAEEVPIPDQARCQAVLVAMVAEGQEEQPLTEQLL